MSKDSKIVKDNKKNKLVEFLCEYTGLAICIIVVLVISSTILVLDCCLKCTPASSDYFWFSSLMGVFGDFVGGFLGTVVAIISVYYLIRTLKEQKNANSKVAENNAKVIESYQMQQFNDKCQNLLSLYNDIKNSYPGTENSASLKLKNITDNLFDNEAAGIELNFADRLSKGSTAFNSRFYTEHRTEAAVHFRVLYQLFGLIYDYKDINGEYSASNDAYSASYSKLVRSQLNESELVLLRYNCYCGYGEKMKLYINHYNLLKHLPLMNLYEFKHWTEKIGSDNVNLRNAIDSELIAQKKWLKTFFADDFEKDEHIYSRKDKKYGIGCFVNKDKKSLNYCIYRNDAITAIDDVDKALDIISDELPEFMNDFLHEVLEYSNFQKFNNSLDYDTLETRTNPDKRITTFYVSVKSKEPIVLSQSQLENRNPQEECPTQCKSENK